MSLFIKEKTKMQPVISFVTKIDFSKLMKIDAAKIGWLFSSFDIDFHFHYPANKIYAVKVADEIAGCIILHESAGRVEDKIVASIGFYIVIDKFRGQKIIGPKLWEVVQENFNKDKFVCFNAAPQAFPFYQRNGFDKTIFISTKYILEVTEVEQQKYALALGCSHAYSINIKKIESVDCINVYNKKIFPNISGQGFRDFIHSWISRPDAVVVGYFDGNELKGYGVLTVCQDHQDGNQASYRTSPIYADTVDIAKVLVNHMISFACNLRTQYIELFTLGQPNSLFTSYLRSLGFVEGGINYVVSNSPEIIKPTSAFLNKIYSILPLEYPCEIVASI
jgi:hypothetical protein